MFEIIQEKMLQEVAEKSHSLARSVKYNRTIAIIHHLFTLSTGFVAYLALLLGFIFADKYRNHGIEIIIVSSVLAISILVANTYFKRHPSFLSYINKVTSNAANNLTKAKQDNPFFVQFWLTLLLIYLPICSLVIGIILSKSPWIIVTTTTQQIFIDSIKQLITFTTVILSIQVVLFTFMFAQLLGKYSSGIVSSLHTAPAILLLWLYPFISLLFLFLIFTYGYPDSMKSVITVLFALLNVICLVLTIWVANTGTLTDKIINYVGNRFSNKVRRKTKSALLEQTTKNHYWTVLNYLGLDWRDSERMIMFSAPSKSVVVIYPLLASLFNVANKAIVEGQQEVFLSAMLGIRKVIAAYIEKRLSYFGTSDRVISYTIDQMASLLSAASKSTNEYLITEVVYCIGDCALSSLQIDSMPKKEAPTIEERMARGNHSMACSWIQLLGEAFELSHTLMRSTAANESINQLARIAHFAFSRGYGEVIFLGYLPRIKTIHSLCTAIPDAYHLTLAGDCIRKTLNLWAIITTKYGQYTAREDLNEQIAETISQMAITRFTVEKLPSFNFSDVQTVLLSKVDRNQLIIQDIFIITIFRNISEEWEKRVIVKDLRRIIKLLISLATAAVSNKIFSTDTYVEALYEISYMVLRGLPEQYKASETLNDDEVEFRGPKHSEQEVLEKELFDCWSKLFPVFFTAETHLGLDWKQNFFGIIGIGMVRYSDSNSDSLKSHLKRLITEYLSLCLKENIRREHGISEWGWDYLQLIGAWTHSFLKEEDLARTIAKVVAEMRPFHYSPMSIGSSHGRYGHYGYPEASLHSDFFLPWLRNLQPQNYLTEAEWDTFRLWQEKIMDKQVLVSFYNIVEETRKPLRDAFYKEIHDKKDKIVKD